MVMRSSSYNNRTKEIQNCNLYLKEVTDKSKTVNEKNDITALDNRTDDIQASRDDNGGDDAEEDGENEGRPHSFGRAVKTETRSVASTSLQK